MFSTNLKVEPKDNILFNIVKFLQNYDIDTSTLKVSNIKFSHPAIEKENLTLLWVLDNVNAHPKLNLKVLVFKKDEEQNEYLLSVASLDGEDTMFLDTLNIKDTEEQFIKILDVITSKI